MKSKNLVVYTISDPRGGDRLYVGLSSSGSARFDVHMSPSHLRMRTRVAAWKRSLIAADVRPVFDIIEECGSHEQLIETERFWIAQFRALGFELLNLTDGGEGLRGYKLTDEHRRKIGNAHRGKAISAEHRACLSKAHKGAKRPPRSGSYSKNVSRANGGRRFCDENGIEYSSYRAAETALGLGAGSVSRVLSGKLVSAKGHSFRYLENQ